MENDGTKKGYTKERHSLGLQQEDIFQSYMECNGVVLDSLSKKDQYSSVDFQVGNKDVFIELKYRKINKDDYDDLVFDIDKINRWKELYKQLPEAIIYIAFCFLDGGYQFIKYDEDVFNGFNTSYLKLYNMTNVNIPIKMCMDLDDFLKEIKILTN